MGRTIQIWKERSQRVSSLLYSPVMASADARDGTMMLRILAISGSASAQISAETTLDPNDPNSWAPLLTVSGSTVDNFTTFFGGYTSGTTEPMGPFMRFRADITLTPGDTIVWSTSITLRG